MECKVIPVRITKDDTDAILDAYKQHLAGKPIKDLDLDKYQYEVFENIIRRVASGKTGTQISQETGYNAFICCEFRSLQYRLRRDIKEAKGRSTKTGIAAAQRLKDVYGVDIIEQQQKDLSEILRAVLAGGKTSCVPLAAAVKVEKFLKMYKKKATVKEMSVTLGITEKYILEMRKIKRESEKSLAKLL